MTAVTRVTEDDLGDLLPLVRGYCDFYSVNPTDEAMLELSRRLIGHPEEGGQFIARDESGAAIGYATLQWTWATFSGRRVGIMNDLFVAPEARSGGVGEALIRHCVAAVREAGGEVLTWQTALDNDTAQALYDRVGGKREQWLDYSLRP